VSSWIHFFLFGFSSGSLDLLGLVLEMKGVRVRNEKVRSGLFRGIGSKVGSIRTRWNWEYEYKWEMGR